MRCVTKLYIIQALNNNPNTLIVQSPLKVPWGESGYSYASIITIRQKLDSLYFDQDQASLLVHLIQCRIWVRPGYFTSWIRPAWSRQNVTWLTWITRHSFNPDIWDRLIWVLCIFILQHRECLNAKIKVHSWSSLLLGS